MDFNQPGAQFGHAVDIVRFGIDLFLGPQQRENQQLVVAGAPGATAPGSSGAGGAAIVTSLDSTGAFAGTPEMLVNVGTPVGAPDDRIGFAVLGADVLAHYDDNGGRYSYGLLAAGEEIVVGAPARKRPRLLSPEVGDGPGAIHLFYVGYHGTVGDDGTASDMYKWFYHGAFTPVTAGAKADFGRSLARAPADYGILVPFLVVGAPGEDAIYIIEPDGAWTAGGGPGFPATAAPFGPTAVVTKIDGTLLPGAVSGDLFGESVHVADLDQDGNVDIIVGAPNTSSVTGSSAIVGNGATWILPGTGTSTPGSGASGAPSATPWVDTTLAFRVNPDMDPDNVDITRNDALFGGMTGASLATGSVLGVDDVPVLVAGVPGMNLGAGGICQHWWPAGFGGATSTRCEGSPFWQADFGPHPNGYMLGTAVAVGNFNRHDTYGRTASGEAVIEEIVAGHFGLGAEAIGTRFYVSGTAVHDHDYVAAPSSVRGGAVSVFRSDVGEGSNVDINNPGNRWQAFAHQVAQPAPAQLDAAFGASVVAENIGTLSPFPRLVVGSPDWDGVAGTTTLLDSGRISVTSPAAANGFEDPMAGVYETVDSADTTVVARVLGGIDGYALVIPGFTLRLVDGSGDACTKDSFTGVVTVDLVSDPVGLTAGGTVATDIVLRDAAGDEVVTLPTTITHNTSSQTLSVSIDEPTAGGLPAWPTKNCRPVYPSGTAFVLDEFVGAACD